MDKIDSTAGTCVAFQACRFLTLQCDGTEDCNGAVCCLDDQPGGGTSCRAPTDCTSQKWVCRTDDDCKGNPVGPHCRPADFGTPGVADRGLDGIVGICQR